MSLNDLGAVPASSTIYLFWTSHDAATGANEATSNLATSDILCYKNGSTTQRSSTSGFTLLDTDGIDFDGLTGVNGVSIDLSDNTDAGFYAVGSWYTVILGPVTIDTQTVYINLASFRIVAAESVTGKPKVDVDAFGGSAGTFSSGRPEVNTTHAAGTAWGSGAITAGSIASDAITAAKIAAGAIDAATFAADVDAEILSYLVDDATRIDASALNTLSGHDPGENIMGATDLTNGGIADAVWDEALAGHTTSGSAGEAQNSIDDILTDTAEIGAAGAGLTEAGGTGDQLTAVPWNSAWDAEVQSEVEDALDVTLADSVPSDGTRPTLRQAMYMVVQFLMERSVSSTTVTVNKVDGSTALLTLTLDDATNPTSITRAT